MSAICSGLVRVLGLGAHSDHTIGKCKGADRKRNGGITWVRSRERAVLRKRKDTSVPYGTHSETLRNVRLNGREKRVKNS